MKANCHVYIFVNFHKFPANLKRFSVPGIFFFEAIRRLKISTLDSSDRTLDLTHLCPIILPKYSALMAFLGSSIGVGKEVRESGFVDAPPPLWTTSDDEAASISAVAEEEEGPFRYDMGRLPGRAAKVRFPGLFFSDVAAVVVEPAAAAAAAAAATDSAFCTNWRCLKDATFWRSAISLRQASRRALAMARAGVSHRNTWHKY